MVVSEETKLYDLVLVVELQEEGGKNVPFISYRYPSLFEQDPFSASVTQFCFPDINKFPALAMPKEIFSFVLTEGDGERRFGYCLRKLPSGTGPRYPVAFSIMAYFPCFPLYSKILERMAYHYENDSMSKLTSFVDSILQHPFPEPGDSFNITMQQDQAESVALRFTRPNDSDSLLEHIDLESLLTMLDERNILIIFAALLVERRIIFCGSQLSSLTNCIQTAVALVYPFSWQHIYIPVLPRSLLSFVCAPMPFVVGILDTELQEVMRSPMDEVLLINVDSNEFIMAPTGVPEDELSAIPEEYLEPMRKQLKSATKQIKRIRKREKEKRGGADEEIMRSRLQYEAKLLKRELTATFIQFFVSVIGSYRQFIHEGRFDKDAFIQNQPADIQQFVENMTTAQMFDCFIHDKLNGRDQGGFEAKIDAYEHLRTQMDRVKNEESSLVHRGSHRSKKVLNSGWASLRKNPFKKDSVGNHDMVLGTPTLVKATSDRSESGQEVAPPVPPKPPAHPPFVVPTKPLPVPPKKAKPPSSYRNTWKPQLVPGSFSTRDRSHRASLFLGGSTSPSVPVSPRGGRGGGLHTPTQGGTVRAPALAAKESGGASDTPSWEPFQARGRPREYRSTVHLGSSGVSSTDKAGPASSTTGPPRGGFRGGLRGISGLRPPAARRGRPPPRNQATTEKDFDPLNTVMTI